MRNLHIGVFGKLRLKRAALKLVMPAFWADQPTIKPTAGLMDF
jgi:hypothetical protein